MLRSMKAHREEEHPAERQLRSLGPVGSSGGAWRRCLEEDHLTYASLPKNSPVTPGQVVWKEALKAEPQEVFGGPNTYPQGIWKTRVRKWLVTSIDKSWMAIWKESHNLILRGLVNPGY